MLRYRRVHDRRPRVPLANRCQGRGAQPGHQSTRVRPQRRVTYGLQSKDQQHRFTLSCCCSYAVGRTTRRHPATSSRIFFPLHLFSPRSCHRLSFARHRLSMFFFFSHEILPLFKLFSAFLSSFFVARKRGSLITYADAYNYLRSPSALKYRHVL